MSRKTKSIPMAQWVQQDRNFDEIAEKFTRNIYGTTKGRIRHAILWQDIDSLMMRLPQRPLRILDAGGGEGQLSCQLAKLGHHIVLCDISANMLEKAQTLAQREGVSDRMQFIHCSAQQIQAHLQQPVDLILFHAVLEWIAEPQFVLQALEACLAERGVLSLMFFNRHALLLRNVMLGNLGYIRAGMPKRKRLSLAPTHPLEPEKVYIWLEEMGLKLLGKSGIRVFHDYLHNKQQQEEDFAAVLELEQHYCRQEPFVSLGRYIHVMAQKIEQKEA